MTKTVIILGDSRSGTSVLSIMTHLLGINMHPDDTPNELNPHGCYEDIEITNAIVNLYNCNKMRHNTKCYLKKLDKLKQIIAIRNAQSCVWGFKCALTHYILDDIKDCFYNPCFVYSFRNIHNQALSEMVRCSDNWKTKKYEFTKDQLIETISKYNRCQTKLIEVMYKYKKYPNIIISKEDVEKDKFKQLSKLAQFLGVQLNSTIIHDVNCLIKNNHKSWEEINLI